MSSAKATRSDQFSRLHVESRAALVRHWQAYGTTKAKTLELIGFRLAALALLTATP